MPMYVYDIEYCLVAEINEILLHFISCNWNPLFLVKMSVLNICLKQICFPDMWQYS